MNTARGVLEKELTREPNEPKMGITFPKSISAGFGVTSISCNIANSPHNSSYYLYVLL